MGGRGRGGTGESAILDSLMRRGLGARSDCRSTVSSFKTRRSFVLIPSSISANSSVNDRDLICCRGWRAE
jgi:hypothetical protein